MNGLSSYNTLEEKKKAYAQSVKKGAVAYTEDGRQMPLLNFHIDKVDFVAGLWRVQRNFNSEIQEVRDQRFVLVKKLPHQEKNHFEFYSAVRVYENAYGLQLSRIPEIVAKYETAQGTFWSYGQTIEQARAFLGIRLYDVYQEVIHKFANKAVKTK